MVELRKYFDRLQDKLGETQSADSIIEGRWFDVVKELNQMSLECAKELQAETRQPYSKYYEDGRHAYDLAYEEAPPTRLLALNLILSYWLGFHDASRDHYLHEEPVAAWRRIKEAYDSGKATHPPVNT